MTLWYVGDRMHSESWHRDGTVIEVDDYGEGMQVVTVEWDGGGTSDFTPDENERKIYPPGYASDAP